MVNMTPSQAARGTYTTSWLKFFSGEERDLWVQNISATQISMGFDIGSSGQIQSVLLPVGSDPICITQQVPWDALKRGMDFRKILNRVPPVMRLLTEEQATAYYQDKAKRERLLLQDGTPDVGAAIAKAEAEYRQATAKQAVTDNTIVSPDGQVTFSPPKSAQELMGYQMPHQGINPQAMAAAGLQQVPQGFANFNVQGSVGGPSPSAAQQLGFANVGHEQPVMMEQVIQPKVLHLCQQVSPQLPDGQRMEGEKFFRELHQMEGVLKLDDFQYIESHGGYPSVKKWARAKVSEISRAAEVNAPDDGLSHLIEGT